MRVSTGGERDGRDGSSITIPRAYTRLYTDAEGHSCLEDVDLQGVISGVGYATLVATFAPDIPAEAVVFRNVLREADDGRPHNAPRRQFIVQMSGWCEIETSRGEVRRFGPGSVLLVEDTDGRGHITRKVGGDGDRLTLVITLPPG